MPAMFPFLRPSLAFAAATALVGVALLGTAPAVHAQATYTETFDGTLITQDPTSFTDETNTWAVTTDGYTGVATNRVYQSTLTSNSFATINVTTPAVSNLANATLTFDLLNAADSGAVLRWDETTKNAIVLIVRPGTVNTPGNDLYFARVANGAIEAGQYGRISLSGTGVNTGGNYRVQFSSYSSASGDLFNASVMNFTTGAVLASTSTTFATGFAPTSGRGGVYQSNQGAPANGLASQFDNVTIQETPEPSTVLLALPALGGVGGMALRRRRRARSK